VHVAQSDVLVGGAEPAKTINDRTFYRRARIHLQRSIISLHVWESRAVAGKIGAMPLLF